MFELGKPERLPETNFWIKVIDYNKFKLGYINDKQFIGDQEIDDSHLGDIINYLRNDLSLEKGYDNMDPRGILPLYIKCWFDDNRVHFGTSAFIDNDWVSFREINVDALPVILYYLEKVLNWAIGLKPDDSTIVQFSGKPVVKELPIYNPPSPTTKVGKELTEEQRNLRNELLADLGGLKRVMRGDLTLTELKKMA